MFKPPKTVFGGFLGKDSFFSKNCFMKKYSNPTFYKNGYSLLSSGGGVAFTTKMVVPPNNTFGRFFGIVFFFRKNDLLKKYSALNS